jgi:hypothetical protein
MPSKLISPIQSKPERIVFADASSFAGAGFVELIGKHTVDNCCESLTDILNLEQESKK